MIIFLVILCVLIVFLLIIYILTLWGKCITEAPFIPLPDNATEEILRALDLKDDSVLYDLGCGDGRLLLKASITNPHIKAVGIERAPLPYLLAKWKTRNHANIQIRREDVYASNIEDATVIFIYLFPEMMDKLLPKLEKELESGARIVTCDFQFKNKLPIDQIPLRSEKGVRGRNIFIYQF